MIRMFALVPFALLSTLACAEGPTESAPEVEDVVAEKVETPEVLPEAEAHMEEVAQVADEAAEEAAEAGLPDFATIDLNANDTIDKGEAEKLAVLAPVFASVDADADGRLSKSEFDAWRSVHGTH